MHELKILAALRENYRSCTSYEDTGITQMRMTCSDSVETAESEFSTIFIRPNLLKFQSKTPDGQIVVQANGESIRELHYRGSQPSNAAVYPSLDHAIGAMEGVSQGVLSIIFGLLDDFAGNDFYSELQDLERLPDRTIDGTECHCISGSFRNIGSVTIWAAKENNVLRRVEKTFSEEVARRALEMARMAAESEGLSWKEPPIYSAVAMIDFNQVTFNNSITIDAIG